MNSEVEIAQKTKQKKIAWVIFFVGLVFVIAYNSSGPHVPNEYDARAMCEIQIQKLLKAPQSAQFSSGHDVTVSGQGIGPYIVKGHVDAPNSFGAMLRSNYICNLRFEGTNALFSEARLF